MVRSFWVHYYTWEVRCRSAQQIAILLEAQKHTSEKHISFTATETQLRMLKRLWMNTRTDTYINKANTKYSFQKNACQYSCVVPYIQNIGHGSIKDIVTKGKRHEHKNMTREVMSKREGMWIGESGQCSSRKLRNKHKAEKTAKTDATLGKSRSIRL